MHNSVSIAVTTGKCARGCILLPLLAWVSWAGVVGQAQEKSNLKLTGRVVDDSTNAPIVNANVFIANSMLGTSSDTSGNFKIRRVPPGSHELVASCAGYFMSTSKIQLPAATDQRIEICLRPNLIKLDVVEITAPTPVAWKENLERFRKLILGSTPEATECRIINPEVLDFSTDGRIRFQAQTDQNLTIDNLALGYRLHLSLETLRLVDRWVSIAWKVKYEELQPSNPNQQAHWERSRNNAYYGSLRHFLVALVKGQLARDGFAMFKSPTRNILPKDRMFELKEDDILRQSGTDEWVIRFDGFLTVEYTRTKVDAGFDYRGRLQTRPKTSVLSLERDSLLVNSGGQILNQLALRVARDWAKEGLARELPLEFQDK